MGVLTVDASLVYSNSAYSKGGGLAIMEGSAWIENSTFSGNQAVVKN